jgi:preprotein translocase subunit SecG
LVTGGIDNRRFSLLSSPFHMSILIWILTFVLLLVSVFLILVVLAQKSKDGGMGAALGGGMTESAFGAETGNVLFNATRNATIAFFIVAFGLYLCHIYQRKHMGSAGDGLPNIPVPAAVSSVPAEKGAAPAADNNATPAATAPLVSLPTAPAPATATPPAAPSAPEPKKP